MQVALYHHPNGIPEDVELFGVPTAVFDIISGAAAFCKVPSMAEGAGRPMLRWTVEESPSADALLSHVVHLDPSNDWILRCDRVDFPPGGIAYRHTHPGPGIRCLLFGGLTVEAEGHSQAIGPLQAWFEAGPDPVLATASATEETAFARAMVLPAQWSGQRTIRYVDPSDADKPRRQSATIFFDEPIRL
jgi:hypothetical protein